MNKLYFKNIEDLTCEVSDKFDTLDKEDLQDIAVVAKYSEARQIIKELLCIGYDMNSVTIENPELDGYEDEYIISLCCIDSEKDIWCEPMVRNGKYIMDESNYAYVLDNCSNEVYEHLMNNNIYKVVIGDSEKYSSCNEDCDFCEKPSCDKGVELLKEDGQTHGFTVSRSNGNTSISYSYYTSDELHSNDISKLLERFGF